MQMKLLKSKGRYPQDLNELSYVKYCPCLNYSGCAIILKDEKINSKNTYLFYYRDIIHLINRCIFLLSER